MAEQRARDAQGRAAREKATAQRAFTQRDEARRLLRGKLAWAKEAEGLRGDPDGLLVVVAELYRELTRLRKELAAARQQLQRSDSTLW